MTGCNELARSRPAHQIGGAPRLGSDRARRERCPTAAQRTARPAATWQMLETAEHRRAQRTQAGEGELHLRLDAAHPGDPASLRGCRHVHQESGLADARLAAEDQHATLTRAHLRDESIQRTRSRSRSTNRDGRTGQACRRGSREPRGGRPAIRPPQVRGGAQSGGRYLAAEVVRPLRRRPRASSGGGRLGRFVEGCVTTFARGSSASFRSGGHRRRRAGSVRWCLLAEPDVESGRREVSSLPRHECETERAVTTAVATTTGPGRLVQPHYQAPRREEPVLGGNPPVRQLSCRETSRTAGCYET
jgi:hypothetical protein